MKPFQGLAIFIVVLVTAPCTSLLCIGLYDYGTKVAVLSSIKEELPAGASSDQMRHFLERHTARFSMNDSYRPQVGGFAPQTTLDKWLFDRSVQILLNVDSQHRFAYAEANVDYTFL